MASSETAFTHPTIAPGAGCSADGRWPAHSGWPIRNRNARKQTTKAARTIRRHPVIGARTKVAPGSDPDGCGLPLSRSSAAVGLSGKRNIGHFSNSLTAIKPAADEQVVASKAVPTMADGLFDPAAANTAMAVIGINCTEPVLIARKVHIAFVAVPGNLLSESRSFMARRPRGVAAFTNPNMFAAMFKI